MPKHFHLAKKEKYKSKDGTAAGLSQSIHRHQDEFSSPSPSNLASLGIIFDGIGILSPAPGLSSSPLNTPPYGDHIFLQPSVSSSSAPQTPSSAPQTPGLKVTDTSTVDFWDRIASPDTTNTIGDEIIEDFSSNLPTSTPGRDFIEADTTSSDTLSFSSDSESSQDRVTTKHHRLSGKPVVEIQTSKKNTFDDSRSAREPPKTPGRDFIEADTTSSDTLSFSSDSESSQDRVTTKHHRLSGKPVVEIQTSKKNTFDDSRSAREPPKTPGHDFASMSGLFSGASLIPNRPESSKRSVAAEHHFTDRMSAPSHSKISEKTATTKHHNLRSGPRFLPKEASGNSASGASSTLKNKDRISNTSRHDSVYQRIIIPWIGMGIGLKYDHGKKSLTCTTQAYYDIFGEVVGSGEIWIDPDVSKRISILGRTIPNYINIAVHTNHSGYAKIKMFTEASIRTGLFMCKAILDVKDGTQYIAYSDGEKNMNITKANGQSVLSLDIFTSEEPKPSSLVISEDSTYFRDMPDKLPLNINKKEVAMAIDDLVKSNVLHSAGSYTPTSATSNSGIAPQKNKRGNMDDLYKAISKSKQSKFSVPIELVRRNVTPAQTKYSPRRQSSGSGISL